MSENKKILVVGDAMLDSYHFGQVNRISPEAPVPVFLEIGKKKYTPGGAANVAVNVASIGVETAFCAVVGKDDYGNILLSEMKKHGIDTGYVLQREGYRTISKLRYIGPGNQQILRVDTEDVSPIGMDAISISCDEVVSRIDDFGLFILSDYLKGLLTKEITQFFIAVAREHNIPVLVDVKDRNISKYEGATLLKPNRKELAELTGMKTDTIEDAKNAAIALCRKANCEYVLATLGADGMILVNKDICLRGVKSVTNEVYDVTGAGDTSIAYLAAELVKGTDIERAMIISNYAAGVQVSKVGTSVVYPDEVRAAMQEDDQETKGNILDFYKNGGLSAVSRLKEQGKKIVFTNGCFDILHAGHITYLREAKRLGDVLVIGVNSDASVKRLKGESRPVNPLEDRELILSSLDFVDYVVAFEEDTPADLINAIMPDVLAKGGDYKVEDIVGAKEVMANGGEVVVIPFVEGKSTTGILKRLSK